MTAVILANGQFPGTEAATRHLRQADMIICCDGAAEKLIAWGREPDLIVGDMDSLPSGIRRGREDRIIHDADQETNDLTKAFKAALRYSPDVIHILGATGRRDDHTMANVSLLADYAECLEGSACSIDMITDYGTFKAFCAEEASFECPAGVEISIFAFDNSLRISCEGLLYQTDRVTFDTLWKATLNTSTADRFSLHLNHKAKVIVFICNPGEGN